MKKWIALFSHTGSEIVNISTALDRWPDKIITNKSPDSPINKKLREVCDLTYTSIKPKVSDYRQLLDGDAIVTMHGWMRIVPEPICNEHDIYNLHPGLITEYPELKGKDPQKKVAESKTKSYNRVGCVIHKAVAEVDAGEVLMERSTTNVYYGEKSLTEQLHKMATDMWVQFLEGKLE